MNFVKNIWPGLLVLAATTTTAVAPAFAQQQKSNILVIMADDIGYLNISAYNRGMMGYRTPNIDRIANEGAIFRYYGANATSNLNGPPLSQSRDTFKASPTLS